MQPILAAPLELDSVFENGTVQVVRAGWDSLEASFARLQQHDQCTCAALCRASLNEGQHFLFLHQPAMHLALEHGRATR